ncbi:MAG TPA: class I SAM-dependent methyltransferase [Burkholderiaceae bacterium]|nr:class I SAM-dependent methyltransferase [Burkholderiaceae bacterium]
MTLNPSSDPLTFKTLQREQWDQAAAGWDAHGAVIGNWLKPATDAMLEIVQLRPGARVLDVAAGAGEQTLAIAQRVGPGGLVLATDLSPAILERARTNAQRAGLTQVRTHVADGEDLRVEPGAFDAALCRLGLMFFPDPLRGLQQMHRALRAGGRVCTLVFSRPERNPCLGILMSTALEHAGLPPRDPYAPGSLMCLGRPGAIEAMFRDAGFVQVATTAIDAPFRLPTAHDYVEFVRSAATPVQAILARLHPAAAAAAWADIEARLARFSDRDGWAGPNELLLTVGRKATD